MHSWDFGQYLRCADERRRPGLDLLARRDLAAPRRVVDLGCGPGNSAAPLRERWPETAQAGLGSDAAPRAAFPPQIDFRVLLPYPGLFLIATPRR